MKQAFTIDSFQGFESVACFRFFDANKMTELFEPISTFVEGKTSTPRVGHNFSMTKLLEYTRVTSKSSGNLLAYVSNKNIKYIVAYLDGDVTTKLHELQHARFFIDDQFRSRVEDVWSCMDHKKRHHIEGFLTRLGYPQHVWVDEFQAYYLTEKPNFFGIRLDIKLR